MNSLTDKSFGSFETLIQEETKCPVCDKNKGLPAGSVSSHGAVFTYILCNNCGLKYMNPSPTEEWYQAHYQGHFWEYKAHNKSWRDNKKKWRIKDFFKRGNFGRMRVQKKRVAQLASQLEENTNLSKGRLILDIGCAYGAIGNQLMKYFGCEVWGIEPNETARNIAVNKNKLKILCHTAEDLANVNKNRGEFSVIMFSNVLENILDPVKVLKHC